MPDLKIPTARDWMTKQYLAVSPETDVFDAIDRLVKTGLSAAPVVDADGRMLGMLTEKDGLRALSQLLYSEQFQKPEVRAHMSPSCDVCEPQMDVFQVTKIFLGCNFPALPVVESGKVVGIIIRKVQLERMEKFRSLLEKKRGAIERAAGHQADRPSDIGSLQQAVGRTTKEQLVRLFGRRTS